MSSPSSRTFPVIQPPSVTSCIRFRVRRKVDLPQPEGPIRACTRLGVKLSDTSFTAVKLPYMALSLSVTTRATPLGAAISRSTGGLKVSSGIETVPPANREPGTETKDEDNHDEDERCGPGIAVPLLVGSGGVGKHGERECGHRLVEIHAEILAAEGREQERCGLARDAGYRAQSAGHYAGPRRADYDRKTGAPAGVAQRQRRLPERVGNQLDHLLRRTEHHGNHQQRQRDAPGQRGEMFLLGHDPGPGKDADHD